MFVSISGLPLTKCLLDWLFGQEPGIAPYAALKSVFLRKHNRFSYQYTWIATCDGQVVGFSITFPGRILPRLDLITGLHLAQIFGLGGALRTMRRTSVYRGMIKAEKDEYFLSNGAVLPVFRRQGIGIDLMKCAEIQARASGLRKCSLLVAYDNEPAHRQVVKMDYQMVGKYDIANPNAAEGSGGYYKLMKMLDLSKS
jgi:ribosomal protein S18 acetylase RimI-like enzyme